MVTTPFITRVIKNIPDRIKTGPDSGNYSVSGRGSSIGSSVEASINCGSFGEAPIAEAGATVEGSFSNQVFTSTSWNGDEDNPITFTFYVGGAEPQIDIIRQRKMEEYLKLKAELRI